VSLWREPHPANSCLKSTTWCSAPDRSRCATCMNRCNVQACPCTRLAARTLPPNSTQARDRPGVAPGGSPVAALGREHRFQPLRVIVLVLAGRAQAR
jgi:hypothetical protein